MTISDFPAFRLGDTVRDKMTGFEGVAVGRHTFMSGTVQYSVLGRERTAKGEDIQILVDWQFLELVNSGTPSEPPEGLPTFTIGDEVGDKVTDFAGMITSKSEFINGCVQYGVQPRALADDGDIVKPRLMDCQRLFLKEKGSRPAASPGGGPEMMPR